MEIIPALMPKSYADLYEKAGLMRGLVQTIQIDIMDGKFVLPLGWPLREGDAPEFQKIIDGDLSLPFWKEVNYEADLMVQHPEENIEAWIYAGFKRIVLHAESFLEPEGRRTPNASSVNILDILDEWKNGGVEIGIAVNVSTPDEIFFDAAKKADFVQVMGIAKIGYQGEPFDPRVIHKISSLREMLPNGIISVDGGVNLENAEKLVAAGADRLCVGSAIWKNENPKAAIERFRGRLQEHFPEEKVENYQPKNLSS